LTDFFQNSFIVTFGGKCAITGLLNVPPHLNTIHSINQSINQCGIFKVHVLSNTNYC